MLERLLTIATKKTERWQLLGRPVNILHSSNLLRWLCNYYYGRGVNENSFDEKIRFVFSRRFNPDSSLFGTTFCQYSAIWFLAWSFEFANWFSGLSCVCSAPSSLNKCHQQINASSLLNVLIPSSSSIIHCGFPHYPVCWNYNGGSHKIFTFCAIIQPPLPSHDSFIIHTYFLEERKIYHPRYPIYFMMYFIKFLLFQRMCNYDSECAYRSTHVLCYLHLTSFDLPPPNSCLILDPSCYPQEFSFMPSIVVAKANN
jgi:hypothetical protein